MSRDQQDQPQIDPTLPEVVQNFLRSGAHLEEIRLDARGRWTHEGLDFENRKVVELFSRSIARTPGGTWVLKIGHFTYPIVVEDVPYFVQGIRWNTSPPLLELSDGTTEPLDPETLRYEPEGKLYTDVKDGAFRARFLRNAYYSVADRMGMDQGQLFLSVDDRRVPLAAIDDL